MINNLIARMRALFHRVFETEIIRRIVRNSSYLVSATVFSAAMGLIQNIFVFRILLPAGIGLLAALATFTNVINRLTSFRIHEMVIRYVGQYEEEKAHAKAAAVFKLAAMFEIAGSLIAFAIIIFLAPLGVRLFSDQPGTEQWFILYGVLVVFNLLFESSDGLLQVFDKFSTKAAIDSVQSLIRVALTIVVFALGGGFLGVILAELGGRLVRAVGITGFAFRYAAKSWGRDWWRTPLSVLNDDRRQIFTFAFSTNLSASISLVAKDSEDLWVNAFLGNVVGGFYSVARSMIGLLQIPISPLPASTYPELSRSAAKKDWRTVAHILRRGSGFALIYSLPITLILIFFGAQIITLYAGANFAPAYLPLIVLVIGYTVVNTFFWNRIALLALNRPVFPTVVNLIGMTIKVSLIFWLGPRLNAVIFAGLLSGYFIFTVGIAALRVSLDVRRNLALEAGG